MLDKGKKCSWVIALKEGKKMKQVENIRRKSERGL